MSDISHRPSTFNTRSFPRCKLPTMSALNDKSRKDDGGDESSPFPLEGGEDPLVLLPFPRFLIDEARKRLAILRVGPSSERKLLHVGTTVQCFFFMTGPQPEATQAGLQRSLWHGDAANRYSADIPLDLVDA